MRGIWIIGFFLCFQGMSGQQATQYSHFITNYLMINPAVTGSAPCLDLKMGYRRQWAGFDEAPRSAFGALQGSLGDKSKNYHGIGAMIETDDTGPLSFTSIHALYAYHFQITRNANLSVGIAAGMMQYRLDYGALLLQSFNDPIVTGSNASWIWPQINFGVWLYKPDRFIGFSLRNLTNNRLKNFEDISQAESKLHMSVTAGRVIDMSDDFSFRPAIQVKYVGKSKASIDVQAMVDYSSKVAVGLGFRGGAGITGLVKVDLFDYMSLAYAYDLTVNKIRFASAHTHEITLGIQACPKSGYGNRLPCSAYD